MLCRGMRKVIQISYNTFSLIKDIFKQFPDSLKFSPSMNVPTRRLTSAVPFLI